MCKRVIGLISAFVFSTLPALAQLESACVECEKLYVSTDDWGIWSLVPTTGETELLGYSSQQMFDIAIDRSGEMYTSDFMADTVFQVNLCGEVEDEGVVEVIGIPMVALGGDRDTSDVFIAGPPLARMDTLADTYVEVGGSLDPGADQWCGVASGDLTVHPTDGDVYVTLRDCAECPAGIDMLATIDPDTGYATNINCVVDAALDPIGHVFSLAFDSSGALWAMNDAAGSQLFSLDTTTDPSWVLATEVPHDGGWTGVASGLAHVPCAPNCANDLTNPEIVCGAMAGACAGMPASVGDAEITVACGEPLCLGAIATDECGPLTLETNQPPAISVVGGASADEFYGESFETPGAYTVSWTATDSGGNVVECSTTVHVDCEGCAIPPAEMRGWWRLDESAGTTAADSASDVANDGTHSGGPLPDAVAAVHGGLCFDGIDDVVVVPHHPEIDVQGFIPPGSSADLLEDFSIDAWVKTSVTAGRQILLDKRAEFQNPLLIRGYMLFLEDGFLGLQIGDSSTASGGCDPDPLVATCTEWIAPGGMVADGSWHFIAATVDRYSSTGGTLWVDGLPVLSFDPTPRSGQMFNFAPLLIGREQPTFGSGTFQGCLDEVEFFERELSAGEIDALWQAGSAGKCKCDADPGVLVCAPGQKEYDVDGDSCQDICVCDAAVVDAQCGGFYYSGQCTLGGDECPGTFEIPVDSDCDGIYDTCEVCPAGTKPHDTDGDGCDDICDCFVPIVIEVTVTGVSWPFDPEITTSDGVFGGIDTLVGTSGDYKSSTLGCVGSAQGSSLPLQGDPPSGQGWWFLVRGNTSAGTGSYDPDVPGWTAGRDAGIAASGRDCP